MRVDRISYQKIFPTGMAYLNHKIGVEIQVEENDDIDEAFKTAKAVVEQWNIESNPSYAMTMEYMKPNGDLSVTQKDFSPSKDERIQSFIATINMCTSLKFLKNFESRVIQEQNDDLTVAYSNKELELLSKTNNQ